MRRRAFILGGAAAAPLAAQEPEAPYDRWATYVAAHNAFAKKFNQGVLDLKLWGKVVREVERIEGKPCTRGGVTK